MKYCGPLAGHESGFHEANGVRLLVTESPALLTPTPGPCTLIPAILRGLVDAPGEPHGGTQYAVLMGWLACAVQGLYLKIRRPGQALVLAGPAGSGKSVVQNNIITPLLGGRSAKCAPYLQGRTEFNGELFGTEHLMLEDESQDTCIKSRLALASNIKQICVNEIQPCHGKNRPIVNLAPWWRLTISLNDEPERLLIIPPLAPDVADKLILLRCAPVAWPLPADGPGDWERLLTAIAAELPAFLHLLLRHAVPPDLHSNRYGVIHWHHPDITRALEELSPEAHLAQLILRWMHATSWRGTAEALRSALLDDDDTRRDARDLLRWPNACGTYLSRLAKCPRPPLRVEACRQTHQREWHLSLSES